MDSNYFQQLGINSEQLASIKKPNVIEQVPRSVFEARTKAIAHSKRDIVWWANNFFRIINLDKGLQVIKLYPKQEEFLRFLVDNSRVVCLSSRQLGKCVFRNSKITIRNTKTGKIEEITIEELFNKIKNNKK